MDFCVDFKLFFIYTFPLVYRFYLSYKQILQIDEEGPMFEIFNT